MKILAIRGENLASLPRFDLSMSEDPLGESGLFVICGPTGAGKSTLLDALCLALYDNTPRLRAGDLLSVVRQSAVEAMAEVDFACVEGHRWRATWRVQRARKKAGGQWQDQTLRLQRLSDGQVVSDHRKTETLRQIERHVGLSFDQFRRSVLLAQGDFALFLQAKGDERAKLLEKITGTEIYAQLSAAAFRRAKDEFELLTRARDDEARYQGLEPEERERLSQRRTQLAAQRAELVRAVEAAQARCAYFVTEERLRAELAGARLELDEATARWREAEVLREEAARWQQAQALRPVVDAADGAARALGLATDELAEARERRAGEAVALDRAGVGEAAAVAALGATRARIAAAAPALKQARALELSLADAVRRLGRAQAEAGDAQAATAQAAAARADVAAALEAARRRAGEAAAWLQGRAGLGAMAVGWPRWEAELVALCAAHERGQALLRERPALSLRRDEAEATWQSREAARRGAEEARQAARRALDEVRAAWQAQREAHPAERVGQERAALGAQVEGLREIARDLADLGRLVSQERVASEAAQAARARGEAARARAEAVAVALRAAADERAVAEADLRLVRATEELAARRPELLAPGRPCPLCGATEHPHAGLLAPGSDAVQTLAALSSRLDERIGTLRREEAAAQAQEREGAARAAEAGETAARAAAEGAVLAAALMARATSLGLVPGAPVLPEGEAVKSRLDEAVRRLRALEEIDARAARLQESLRRSQEEHDRHRDAHEALAQEVSRLVEARAEAAQALLRHDERAASAQERRAQALADLGAPVAALGQARLDAALQEDPARLRDYLTRAVAEHAARARAGAEAEESARALAGRLALADEALGAAEAMATQRAGVLASCESALHGLRGERAEVLNALAQLAAAPAAEGRATAPAAAGVVRATAPVAEGRAATDPEDAEAVEARLRQAATAAEERLEAARQEALGAQRRHAAAEASLELAARREESARAGREEAAARLRAALDAAGDELRDEDTARRWLARDAAWHRQRLAEIERRHDELTTRRGTCDDRLRRLREHLRSSPDGVGAWLDDNLIEEQVGAGAPGLPPPPPGAQLALLPRPAVRPGRAEAEAALTAAEHEREVAADELFRVELTLSQDEEKRTQRATLREEIDARAAAAQAWGRLSELIGSHDGKKFRQFAQGLTLDTLLLHTNEHLVQLRPRYRIERMPGTDMDLQVVDRDMGDEVRGCATLSGGESFLVSLALALGLSSLSARNVRVESLFIDEGFGTLDRDTLDAAISTLEQLHAGGRQVGLISHVQDLADRIGYQVLVQPRRAGTSEISVSGGRL